MSRIGKRASTKALVCFECSKGVKPKAGVASRVPLTFRGKSQARLNKHLKDVHGYGGGSRKFEKHQAKLAAKVAAN
jgi:hypothetical protein